MKRLSLLALLLTITSYSHAGFITGAVIGSSLGSDKTAIVSTTIKPGLLGYDVIVCCTSHLLDFRYCSTRNNKNLTPEQFAKAQGYRSIRLKFFIPRTSVECPMIGMEVAK